MVRFPSRRTPCAVERSHRIAVAISLALIVLGVTSWVRENDPTPEREARAAELRAVQDRNAELEEEAQAGEARVERLRSGDHAIDREAREAFPLVREGETTYVYRPATEDEP